MWDFNIYRFWDEICLQTLLIKVNLSAAINYFLFNVLIFTDVTSLCRWFYFIY